MFNQLNPQQLAALQLAAALQYQMQPVFGFGHLMAPEMQSRENIYIEDEQDDDEDDEQKRTLFIANLDDRVTEELLYELFLQAGPIESARIPKGPNGQKRTFGFVTYVHQCTPPYAIQLFKGLALHHKTLTIKFQGQTGPTHPSTSAHNLPADCIRERQRRGGGGNNRFDNSSLRSSNYPAFSDAGMATGSNESAHNPFKKDSPDWMLGSSRQKDRQRSSYHKAEPARRSRERSRDRDRSRSNQSNRYQAGDRRSEQRNNSRR